ncbi:hypothetical protein MTO96_036166 [Rhipicephalus appendiculatus]
MPDYAMALSLEITLSTYDLREKPVIVLFVMAAAVAGNFVLSEVQDLVISRPKKHSRKRIDQDTQSVFGRRACTVLYSIFKDMLRKGTAATKEIPILRRGLVCEVLVGAFGSRMSASNMASQKRHAFYINLFKVLWVDIIRVLLATVGYYACILARIPALELLISSSTGVGTVTATLLFAMTTACEFLMTSFQMDILNMFGCRGRTVLTGYVFKKVTSMSTLTRARYTAGRISSILSVDCWQVGTCCFTVALPLFGALSLPLVFWMLATRAGVGPSLCCAAWTVIVLCLPLFFSSYQKFIWGKVVSARDERLKVITDMLATIRVVKMYAWEDSLQENVTHYNERELKWLFRVNLLDAILDCIYSSTSSVVRVA